MTEFLKTDVLQNNDLKIGKFDDKDVITSLINAILEEVQLVLTELVKYEELINDVDKATGVYLDRIGGRDNVKRDSTTDTVYRDRIKFQRALYASQARPAEVLSIIKSVTKATVVRVFDYQTCVVNLDIETEEDISIQTLNFIETILPAGCRVDFINVLPKPSSGLRAFIPSMPQGQISKINTNAAGDVFMLAGEPQAQAIETFEYQNSTGFDVLPLDPTAVGVDYGIPCMTIQRD